MDVHIPIIACLCEALLMSIIVNIYFMCTMRHKELGQRIYHSVTSLYCCNTNEQQSEQQRTEQDEAEDAIKYSTLDFANKRKERKRQEEGETEETLYSGLASLGLE
ncbi:hypothetical protein MHYP_G00107840 [Metynnis hypsauchen]